MNYLDTKIPIVLFQHCLNSELYVDKSLFIRQVSKSIRTGNRYICLTRPRRFGKTVNAGMLGAYFTKGYDTHSQFDSLAIARSDSYEKHLNQYHVIYIDCSRMPDFCSSYEQYLKSVIGRLKEDLMEAYPGLRGREYDTVSGMLLDSADSFIFILDKWDFVFYQKFMSEDDRQAYLLFLKNLLKDQPYADLAYMTGVLPVAKYSSGSALNMFEEYNFTNDNVFDSYFGFQEDEVRELCRQHPSVPYEEMKAWYDGYYTSDGKSLFNPRSVINALMRGRCLNYWTETGPMNEIADCIEHNVDEVREDIVKLVAGIPVSARLKGYSAAEQRLNTRDEILSAMAVYGFLSYYDGELKIPNRELMEKYQEILERESFGGIREIVESSREMLKATLACEEEKVAEILEKVHDREIPFLQYHDENSLSCVITLCYIYARNEYEMIREAKSGKGFCDYLFLPVKPGRPAIILELKKGRSCEEALNQIKKRGYMQRAEKYGSILLVGISYDEKKHHSCRIEEWRADSQKRGQL